MDDDTDGRNSRAFGLPENSVRAILALLSVLISGALLGMLGYAATMLYWRYWVSRNWKQRKLRRRRHS